MWAKTTFWYAVMALTVVASAVAGPLDTLNTPDAGNEAINIMVPSNTVTLPADGSVDEQQRKEQPTELAEESSEAESVPVNPDTFDVMTNVDVKPDESVVTSVSQSTTPATGTDSQSTTPAAAGTDSPSTTPAAGTDLPSTVAAAAATGTDSPTSQPGPATYGKKPKPYYAGGVHSAVNLGPGMPNLPFFMEFFQPFQPFQPYGHQPGPVYQKQPPPPFRNQPPQPFGVSVDPFNPFASGPAQSSPFHQLVEAYTNEFRNMLENFEKMPTMPQMTNLDNMQAGSGKHVPKTTTKTEIIDGHVVQINETTYSNGDDNHKTFYHYKEIQVLPDTASKKIATEKLVSMTKDDSESQREDTNEIGRDTVDSGSQTLDRDGGGLQEEARKAEPVSLDEHYQTAAASYYSPYAPAYYGQRPPVHSTGQQLVYYGRPPPVGHGHPMTVPGPYGHPMMVPGPYGNPMMAPGPYGHQMHYEQQRPISLYGDTLVNDLLDASNQAAGVEVVLPPDVELIDVNRKPQRGNQQLYYKNHQRLVQQQQPPPTPSSRLQQVFRAPIVQ